MPVITGATVKILAEHMDDIPGANSAKQCGKHTEFWERHIFEV
jgi:hypothetical protein